MKDPMFIPLSAIEPRTIAWLWRDRIPIGCITMLEGDGGVGKSFVISALGSAISRGGLLPDDIEPREPAKVLLLAAEDDPAVVLRPRFETQQADLDNVFFWRQEDFLLNEAGFTKLRSAVLELCPRLIVIDPVVSFLGTRLDTSKATDVRSVMQPLHDLANETACAIIVVRHWNKSNQASASQRGSGSVDFRNASRSVLQVIKTPDNRFITVEKSNYGADGRTLTFSIEEGKLVWTGASDMNADALLEAGRSQATGGTQDKAAREFIKEILRDGPISSEQLLQAADSRGIAQATLMRAKRGIARSLKKGVSWYWQLEDANVRRFYEDTQDDQETQDSML